MDQNLKTELEDLRIFYITPLYLETMRRRIQSWRDETIREQIALFRETIPDYPEVMEILEGELHRRELNRLHHELRNKGSHELKALLKTYKDHPDHAEIIRTALEIRNGATRLSERAE
jgi:hypothetical protein